MNQEISAPEAKNDSSPNLQGYDFEYDNWQDVQFLAKRTRFETNGAKGLYNHLDVRVSHG